MRVTRREAIGAVLSLAAISREARADESILFAEAANDGRPFQIEIDFKLAGHLSIERDGKADRLPIEAKGTHRYVEAGQAPHESGQARRVVRLYREATTESTVGGERTRKQLAADRRGIVVHRGDSGSVHFSPSGPLTRDELELVSEHFESLVLPNLLPAQAVKPGDTWSVPADAAQTVCHFDGLVKSELIGKYLEIKDGSAILAIDGRADGVEHGAAVRVAVAAKLTYDLTKRLITRVEWSQADGRDRGPVSPAMEVKAAIVLTRTRDSALPKEFEAVVAKQPADGKIPELLLQLRHTDPSGYEFVHARDWHAVVKNDKHLVLRLLAKGEYVAQATIAAWKPEADQPKAILTEFVDATRKQPGWEPEKVIEDGEMQVGSARPIYRLAAVGKQDGAEVVQAFHLVTAADGRRVVAAVVCGTNSLAKLGNRDVALVSAIEFPDKK